MSFRGRAVGAVVLAALLAAGCAPDAAAPEANASDAAVQTPAPEPALPGSLAALRRTQVTVGSGEQALVITAFVADTAETRARGLQGITEVPEGTGMLFVFDGSPGPGGRPGFWMLDTLVPLDIAFAADGVVVGVATMTPCAGPPCPITHPGVDYDVALEVAAGVLSRAQVQPGDPFVWVGATAG